MTSIRIGDVAARSGFTAPTLRYYEEIGLLPKPLRSPAGYRSYDASVLDRLAFIARLKELGCSLDEIPDLLRIWDGGICGPLQERLRVLVAEKEEAARKRSNELAAFADELRAAVTRLEHDRPAGPCDEQCGCISLPPKTSISQPIVRSAKPTRMAASDDEPIACSLSSTDLAMRVQQWRSMSSFAVEHAEIVGGKRVRLANAVPLAELTNLIAAEVACCSFFSFALHVDSTGAFLDVRAPADAHDLVEALLS